MSGHRQAAAALYALARADQETILTELAPGDRRILRGFLAELSALGFDKAANMAVGTPIDQASDAVVEATDSEKASPAHEHQHAASIPDSRARLRGATAAQVFAAVSTEPPALIAQLVAIEPWPWTEAMLAMLPTPRSRQVQMTIDSGVSRAPACEQFLVNALNARLGERRSAPRDASTARIARLALSLRRWLPWTR
ncbi:hypothetical protein [Massilia sp. TSP1-1-2]|uniref:hypothetical protein n=1 Tax=Massilia sp. TSP1-1-2 TaxID=2804649 RepID=UPI003CF5BD1A